MCEYLIDRDVQLLVKNFGLYRNKLKIAQFILTTHLPYSLSISFATHTVSSDYSKMLANALNFSAFSDTVVDSALNGPSANEPPDFSTSSKVSLDMTVSVYNVWLTSLGRTSCERVSKCFSSI